jgi:hypothetical protein
MHYDVIYQDIIRFVKANGVKHVVHKDLDPRGLFGLFHPDKNTIAIDKRLKNTHDGCFFLLHEYIHYKQWSSGKYKRFFNITSAIPKHEQRTLLEYVVAVEQETDEEAMWLLWHNWAVFFDGIKRQNNSDKDLRWLAKYYFNDETLFDPVKE